MRNPSRRCIQVFFLLSAYAGAQSTAPPAADRGMVPGRTFELNSIENISIESGNLFLNIPLASLPAGPGGSGFSMGITYNSAIFDQSRGLIATSTSGGGWNYNWQYSVEHIQLPEPDSGTLATPSTPPPGCAQVHQLSVIFPDGSQHLLHSNIAGDPGQDGFYDVDPVTGIATYGIPVHFPACNPNATIPNPLIYSTIDGTYARLEVITTAACGNAFCSGNPAGTWILYLPDGRRVFGSGFNIQAGYGSSQVSSIQDRNGNVFSFLYGQNSNGDPTVTVIDEVGYYIRLTHTLPSGSAPVDVIDGPGANSARLQSLVSMTTTSPSYSLYYACSSEFSETNVCTVPPVSGGVGSIQIPSTSGTLKYNFQYNSNDTDHGLGEVKSMTLPYGLTVQYGYQHTAGDQPNNISFPLGDRLTGNPVTSKTVTYTDSLGTQRTESSSYDVWSFSDFSVPKVVHNPDGGTRQYFRSTTSNARYDQPRVRAVIEPNGDRTDRTWAMNCPNQFGTLFSATTFMNAYVKAEFRAIQSSLGAKISSQFFNYDRNGNRLGLSQYDLVPAYTFSTDQYGSPLPQVPSGATLIRSTANTFARNAGASIDADPQTRCSNAADDAQGYWHELETAPGAAAKLDSPASMQISDLNGIRARTEYTYDNALTTGNPTKETSWDSTMGAYSNPLSPSNSISTSHTYDAGGNVTSTTDPNGVATSYAYGNPFSCPSADGTRFANPFSMTKAGLTTQFRWDCGVALPTYTVDPNGVTTKRTYDNLGRTTLLQEAWTLGTERQTLISYNETAVDPKVPLIVTTSKDLTTTGDLLYITTQKFDQRGQAAMQQVGDATTQHLGPVVYGGASYEATANPQFATADATAGWARTTRDTMGRPNRVDYFAGGTPPFPWGNNPSLTASATTNYNGYSTTIIDENFNVRQQIVDGAGRLASVTEDPTSSHQTTLPILNYLTSYQYDFHDNLTAACQNGQFVNGVCQSSQTARSFTYSSLGRLLTVTNPESGQTNYTYDQNGNLLTKRDARVTVTTFAFDNLNRLRSKTYSDGTATATYCYGDDATNQTVTRGAGSNALSVAWSCQGAPSGATNYLLQRLTKVAGDQSQTQYTQYDPLGNIKVSQQTTSNPNSATYPFSSYMYNTHGLLTSMALPSGRTLSWTYDTSVRPIGVSGVFTGTGTTTYASVPVGGFWPNAAIKTLKLAGNNLTQSSVYDSRLRPMSLSVTSSTASDTLGYSWNANGNLQQETINNSQNPLTLTQTFAYDSINRLISVNESGGSNEWNQAYGYDPWGSRSLLVPTSNFVPYSGVTPQASPPTVLGQTVFGPFTNNRFNSAGYDAAGNETTDSTVTTASNASYDAESRLQTVTGLPMGVLRYYYDGDGRRVMKVLCSASPCSNATSGAQITTFVYDAMGQLTAEYGSSGTVSGAQYLFSDHLGSTRLMLSGSGSVTRCYDYAPFGEELRQAMGSRSNCYLDVTYPSATAEAVTAKFTSKERDAETGLDYFGFRYLSSAQGRWTSPDAPFADQHPEDPQSWNMYAYVRNNPLLYTDADGRDCTKGFLSCINYVAGGVGAVGNAFTSGLLNAPNRIINATISPFTSYQLPDAFPAAFTPSNSDQQEGVQAANAMMIVSPLAMLGTANATTTAGEVPLILRNAAKGRAFQNQVAADTALTDTNVVQNVTVKTASGVRTQIDVVSTNAAGNIVLQEAKSSASAPLTPAQAAAHPEISRSGATVVGQGKPPYVGGTQIPPTPVQVVRPQCPGPGCPP